MNELPIQNSNEQSFAALSGLCDPPFQLKTTYIVLCWKMVHSGPYYHYCHSLLFYVF